MHDSWDSVTHELNSCLMSGLTRHCPAVHSLPECYFDRKENPKSARASSQTTSRRGVTEPQPDKEREGADIG